MRLSRIPIFFLLLLRYDIEVSCRHDGHFIGETKLVQDSLAARLYDDTSLDPFEDDDEIEVIIDNIIDEAHQRLRSHGFGKRSFDDEDEDSNGEYIEDRDEEEETTYREALRHAYNDVVEVYKKKDKRNSKKQLKEKSERKKVKKEVEYIDKNKDNIISTHDFLRTSDESKRKRDTERVPKGLPGDNIQVAGVQIDNSETDFDDVWSKVNFMEVSSPMSAPPTNRTALYAQHKGDKNIPHQRITSNKEDGRDLDKISFIAVVAGCCVAGVAGIALASFCWYKLRSEQKAKGSVYKSSSVRSNQSKISSDEEKLARGAEVFHYLHAKKQLQQMEDPNHNAVGHVMNESTDDEDDEDTVYECPGLAPPGDMKVVNPLFSDPESHYSDPSSLHSTPTPPLEDKY